MKKQKSWRVSYGGIEDGRQYEAAGIFTPEGKSIFNLDFDEFVGISNRRAERIVALLNKAEKL